MRMSAADPETIELGGSSTIHVGPIMTNGSNETISIVIPLSAQVATMTNRVIADEVSSGGACNDCGKDFIPKAVTSERQRVAENPKGCPFSMCSRYGRAFSRAHDLKRHIARHEAKKETLSNTMNVDVHSCSICGRHYMNESVLQKHVQIHENSNDRQEESRMFVCHLCKKRHGRKTFMATHDKFQKPISRVCTLCDLRFGGDCELQEHMKKHTITILESQSALVEEELSEDTEGCSNVPTKLTGFRPAEADVVRSTNNNASNKIRCDYCWKTFKSKWTLNSHVAAHEGRFQFECDQCGKRFVRKSHFEGHMRSHEAARPYACEICGSTFKQAKHRREHIKRKHPETQNAVQNLLDSISACVSEESSVDQPKFTILVPVEFDA